MDKEFEIGPIRPPSEAESLLLRITRNCPWNKCRFCKLYRGHPFVARTVAEIKADIDRAAQCREDIYHWAADGTQLNYNQIWNRLFDQPEEIKQNYLHVLQWIASGAESVFLQDANAMVLSYGKLQEILTHLREKLPQVKRVTSYGRVDALNKFSVEQLVNLRSAGLDRIHSGFESGSDKVLELINKGYTKAQEIEAGRKVIESGIELSIYYMPGAGGRVLSDENAIETADVVNKVNPDFVRIRTFAALPGSEIYDDFKSGKLASCTDIEKMLELKRMIENADCATGHLYSDHVINLFEEVNGSLGSDREKMLDVFKEFLGLDTTEQKRYQLARRMGMVRSLADFWLLGKARKEQVDELLSQLDTEEKFEQHLSRLIRRYI